MLIKKPSLNFKKKRHLKGQILVVDDNLIILKILFHILSKQYNIVIKNSGLIALSWLQEGNTPALIITDLQMPYFDGQSFIKNLKISGLYKDIPVIILSGADDLAAKVKEIEQPVDDFLPKPFNPKLLMTVIDKVLALNYPTNIDLIKTKKNVVSA